MERSAPFDAFTDIVTSLDDVRGIVGPVNPKVLAKDIDFIDDICRDFIAMSPFCVIATAGADGHIDLSPKGDPAGFVRVPDDHHLAIPDRPGNHRIDTFRNILENPRVGVIFLIPVKGETLRVVGEARITRDPDLLATMAVKDRPPQLALVVHVERAFMHCPKCVIRSNIWKPEA
ncbi:MAG: pyridoxamine 5'-phosphate oxidase family protein, partial [Planctomycetes bacterium]|nr:pyridoxamine 5'-phosphate oxidase family protein [Planctomycetota bacterium]